MKDWTKPYVNEFDQRRINVMEQEKRKKGLRGKINAKCAECIFDPNGGGGTWREQVMACTSYSCPLYEVRPMPAKSAVDSQKGSNDAVSTV